MELTPVKSSTVAKVGYNSETSELHVEFSSGAQYKYEAVEEGVYESMLSAESIGKFLNSNIKEKYEFQKI
jgi:hypothetical protein